MGKQLQLQLINKVFLLILLLINYIKLHQLNGKMNAKCTTDFGRVVVCDNLTFKQKDKSWKTMNQLDGLKS